MNAGSPCLRFSFSESRTGGPYIARSLDKGQLRCWRSNEVSEGHHELFSGSREEGAFYAERIPMAKIELNRMQIDLLRKLGLPERLDTDMDDGQ